MSNGEHEREPPWLVDVEGDQVRPLVTLDVPVLRVPAGPGTGKTLGLRKRVLRLLHPDGLGADPSRVLVCAFNRVIARDLRDEISAELERFELELPVIQTIHRLAGDIAGRWPRFLLPQEAEAMIYDILVAHPAIAAGYDNRLSRAMRALREHEARLDDHPDLAQAATAWLGDHGAELVGDLPRRVEAGLRAGDYADRRFDHVIVDEFQDLTDPEARLALGLRAAGGSLVALGDKKQSIYAFRGNENRGLDALPELVDDRITDHVMDECRRCPAEIVVLANAVMPVYHEPLVDVRGPGAQIHHVHFREPADEHSRMAHEIVRAYRRFPASKHLVLVTRRRWGYELRRRIAEIDPEITAQTVFSEDILETWPAREAFIFLSIVADPADPVALRDWISYRAPDDSGRAWKAPRRNAPVYQWLRRGGVLTVDRIRMIANGAPTDLRGTGRTDVHRRAVRLRDLLDALPGDAHATELVAVILDPDQWIDAAHESADLARTDITRLRTEADRMLADDEEFSLRDLVRRIRNRIAAREPMGQTEGSGVRIVTLWGAKGLTADYTYIVGLCDEALPGPWDPESTGLSEGDHRMEQLRLLYVSLTRAKTGLAVTRPTSIQRGQVMALGLAQHPAGGRWRQDLRMCRFLSDLPRDVLPDSVPGEEWEGLAWA